MNQDEGYWILIDWYFDSECFQFRKVSVFPGVFYVKIRCDIYVNDILF